MTLSGTFAALADPTRRAILRQLRAGELTVGQVAAPHQMSLPAVTKHLRVLEDAGLARRRRSGRQVLCSLPPRPDSLTEAADWIHDHQAFWDGALDQLEDLLALDDPSEEA